MRKSVMLFSIIALVLVALMPAAANVSAQTTKFPGYVTGTQIMNLSSNSASVSLRYISADDGTANGGSTVDTASDEIGGNSSKSYYPTMSPFKGSMVVSSSQPIGAVTNLQNSAKTAGASYVGASEGATVVQMPLLLRENGGVPYSTWFSVQNAGSADATISIKYTDCANPIEAVIKPGASKTFYQYDETCHTKKVFSGSITPKAGTTAQPLVVVVVEENVQKLLAYNGFPGDAGDISTDLVMPLVNTNNTGITTGIQIQNTADTDAEVTLEYTPSVAGTACTETQTIVAHESASFALYAFMPGVTPTSPRPPFVTSDCVSGERFVGSARVKTNTGGGLLVGIVNQTKSVYGEAYGAFNPNLATPRVVLPLLMDRNGAPLWSTGFSVMNVGNAATWVKCSITNLPAGVNYAPAKQLQPNEALAENQKSAIGQAWVGSGICAAYTDNTYATIDTNAKLVAVVNEIGTPTQDRLLVYEGINTVP